MVSGVAGVSDRGYSSDPGYSGGHGGDELDADGGRGRDGDGQLVGEEVVVAHGGDVGLRVGGPYAHGVRVGAGVVLDGLGGAAVGVALAEDGINGGTLDLVVTGAGVLLGVGLGRVGEVGDGVTVGLELGDRLLELRDGGGDVGELDDVGLGLERQGA